MRRLALRATVLLASTLVCLLLAELALRALAPRTDRGELYYADAEYREFALQEPLSPETLARAAELIETVPGAPRFRLAFKPNVLVRLCYRGCEGQDGLDARGCVEAQMNSFGVREREELCSAKPAGQRRVVCVGDSTTFGWGVRAEATWPRLAEARLRATDDGLRLVNCGAAGTLVPDEYAHALANRFARFSPDLVLATLCVNDLLPVNGGMSCLDPVKLAARDAPLPGLLGASAFASAIARAFRDDPLAIDPSHDLVAELLALPLERYPEDVRGLGAIFWGSGVPEAALRTMRDWCRERRIPFAVALWPFLQQLETRATHPFRGIHERVAAFCAEEGIPCLDLLDAFVGRTPRELWVTPLDMHGNERAQAIAAERYAAFLAPLLRG